MSFRVVYDTESFCDGFDAESLGSAKNAALDILNEWVCAMLYDLPGNIREWSEEDIDKWDSMIENCWVWVMDGGEEVWSPSADDCKQALFVWYDDLKKQFCDI